MLMAEAQADQLLRNIDDVVRADLTREQLAAIRAAAQTTAGATGHPVDLRVTLPTPFGEIFLAFVAGREKRHPDRREQDRAHHALLSWGNLLFCASFLGVASLAGACLVFLLGGVVAF